MADSTEVIQQQMEETRHRLAENLDKLSQNTVGAVAAVTETVTETVGTVQDTVQAVHTAVTDTVGGVKEMFDLRSQADKNPWLVVGGAAAVGFFVGCVLPPSRQTSGNSSRPTSSGDDFSGLGRASSQPQERTWPHEEAERSSHRSGWLTGLTERVGPVFDKLKGLAIGTAIGIARDAVTQSMSNDLATSVREVVDDLTTHLGGKPVPPGSTLQGSEGHPPYEPSRL